MKGLEALIQQGCGLLYELFADLVGMAPAPVFQRRALDPLIEGA